jgi:hypothetical protein
VASSNLGFRWFYQQEVDVNRLTGAFALIMIAMAGLAAAQPAPSQSGPPAGSTPPNQYQENTAPSQSSSQYSSTAASKSDQKARMDDCMAQQRANNPGMSKHDMKKTCKDQVKNTPHD